MSVLNYSLGKNKKILFFGVNHSNSDFLQIKNLKDNLVKFNPDLILIEGGFERANFETEKESISQGELGFASYFSKRNNFELLGNDPPEKDSINFLNSIYGGNFSFLYFVLRNFSYFISIKKISSDEKGLLFAIEDFVNTFNEDIPLFSIQKFKEFFFTIFKKPFSFKENYSSYASSLSQNKKMKQATKRLSLFRDFYMFNKILNSLKEKDRIFIIKGESHLEIFKRYFKDFFE